MRRVIFATLSTIVGLILLLSFKSQATTTLAAPPAAISTPNGPSSATASNGATGPSTTVTPSTGSAGSADPTGSTGSKTEIGAPADTRYGPVQVKITVTNGAVTAVRAVEYPQESPRDAQINSYAIPQLDQEATAAKSANIDMISGATYTSTGYMSSLQSALNEARIS